jgi:hypothetical protein
MAAKLHELLAVEQGLQTAAKKINEETVKTFGKRDEHFVGTVKEIRHFAEEDVKLDVTEIKEMVSTVAEKLRYAAVPNIRALDAFFQKEATNQKALADLVIDDKVLVSAMPGTALLGLESKLTELREVYAAIPTLSPGPSWVKDMDRDGGGNVYRSEHPDVTFRTRRVIKPIIMSPATKEHPAQVQAVNEDVPVAKINTQHLSGMLTTAEKSDLLGRLDKLIRAAKRARQRANSTEVIQGKVGKTLLDFIHGDSFG